MDKLNTEYINNKINFFTDEIVDFLPTLLLSLFIFVIFYVIAQFYYNKMIFRTKPKNIYKSYSELDELNKLDSTDDYNDFNNNLIYYQLNWIVYYSIIVFGILVALVNMGFNVATIVTLLGTIGLALGLALQETIKNIISGIFIGINNLFKIGDMISLKPIVNINVTSGKVIDFNLYYTTLVDMSSGSKIMVPNNIIQNNLLINHNI
jgi:small-conductance mechanosensitive channel